MPDITTTVDIHIDLDKGLQSQPLHRTGDHGQRSSEFVRDVRKEAHVHLIHLLFLLFFLLSLKLCVLLLAHLPADMHKEDDDS